MSGKSPSFKAQLAFSHSFFATLHTITYMIWPIPTSKWREGSWKTKMVVPTGAFLVPAVVIHLFSSLPRYRKAWHRAFRIVHISRWAGYFSIPMLHGFHKERPQSYKYLVSALVHFLSNRGLTMYRAVGCSIYISAEVIEAVGRNVINITMPRLFYFRSGQFVGICTT